MIITKLESARLKKISGVAYQEIIRLNNKANSLWNTGINKNREIANLLLRQADFIYKKEVLYRKFEASFKKENKKMYLIIMEDGEIIRSSTYSKEDLRACKEGILDIIDISDPECPTYYNGRWKPVHK